MEGVHELRGHTTAAKDGDEFPFEPLEGPWYEQKECSPQEVMLLLVGDVVLQNKSHTQDPDSTMGFEVQDKGVSMARVRVADEDNGGQARRLVSVPAVMFAHTLVCSLQLAPDRTMV